MAIYSSVGTVGGGVFSITHHGEFFGGLVRIHRRGTLESAEFFAELVDKRKCDPLPEDSRYVTLPKNWFSEGFDDQPVVALEAEWFDEIGNAIAAPSDTRIPGWATESDYHDRILPLVKRLEKRFA